jgi:hypothetical protein
MMGGVPGSVGRDRRPGHIFPQILQDGLGQDLRRRF